jgi:hypothetical protein
MVKEGKRVLLRLIFRAANISLKKFLKLLVDISIIRNLSGQNISIYINIFNKQSDTLLFEGRRWTNKSGRAEEATSFIP